MGRTCGEGAGGSYVRGRFSKRGSKKGILVHSEQIVKGGCGHWISPLCTTVLKFENESEI